MKPVEFKGQNIVFGADQEQYNNLPAIYTGDDEGMVVTCWEVTDEDLEEIKKTRKIYLSQLTFNRPLQPLKVESKLENFFGLREGE